MADADIDLTMEAGPAPSHREPSAESLAIVQQAADLLARLQQGHPLGEDLGYSVQEQEVLYHMGYTHYEQAKYEDAVRVFAKLVVIDHMDRRYHSGLGAALLMQKKYAEALQAFNAASVLKLTDPVPCLHMAECQLALGKREDARINLTFGLAQARAWPEHHGLVGRLEAMLEFLDAAEAGTAAKGETQ